MSRDPPSLTPALAATDNSLDSTAPPTPTPTHSLTRAYARELSHIRAPGTSHRREAGIRAVSSTEATRTQLDLDSARPDDDCVTLAHAYTAAQLSGQRRTSRS